MIMRTEKSVASTEYAVEIHYKGMFDRQVDCFSSYEEACAFVDDANNQYLLGENDEFHIVFIDYDENGNEIQFGPVC